LVLDDGDVYDVMAALPGPDANGISLEVAAVERADGGHVVIHVMRSRPSYAAEYAEEMRCR